MTMTIEELQTELDKIQSGWDIQQDESDETIFTITYSTPYAEYTYTGPSNECLIFAYNVFDKYLADEDEVEEDEDYDEVEEDEED